MTRERLITIMSKVNNVKGCKMFIDEQCIVFDIEEYINGRFYGERCCFYIDDVLNNDENIFLNEILKQYTFILNKFIKIYEGV